jgi:hypothetical protein
VKVKAITIPSTQKPFKEMFFKMLNLLYNIGGWGLSGWTLVNNIDNLKSFILFALSVLFLVRRGYSYYLTVKKNKLKLTTSFESYRISERERLMSEIRSKARSENKPAMA